MNAVDRGQPHGGVAPSGDAADGDARRTPAPAPTSAAEPTPLHASPAGASVAPDAATDPLVHLRGVGKRYPMHATIGSQLANLWARLRGTGTGTTGFAALEDIGFDIMRGASTALVGVNGAGKSTLLKIIAGVVRPSQGEVVVRGRVGALLELGAGFHPEYTGRENIELGCALMGIAPGEARELHERIVAFADIGAHIDQPIKHYSSGMVVRLGFAIATAVEPDLLITDEVLAVGDESFQRKCIAWMENYLANGGTLLLCSHSMYHVQKLCQQAAWIDAGRLRRFGSAADVTREYLGWHEERTRSDRRPAAELTPDHQGFYLVRSMRINGLATEEPVLVPEDSVMTVTGTVYSPDGRAPRVAVGVAKPDGTAVAGCYSEMDGFTLRRIEPQLFAYQLDFLRVPLLPGRYLLRSHAMDPEGMRMFDHVELPFDVVGPCRETGLCKMEHRWS